MILCNVILYIPQGLYMHIVIIGMSPRDVKQLYEYIYTKYWYMVYLLSIHTHLYMCVYIYTHYICMLHTSTHIYNLLWFIKIHLVSHSY